jgi:hypothetical protein
VKSESFSQRHGCVTVILAVEMLLVLFDDEMIGHAGDVVADHAGQGFLFRFLLIVVRQG